MACTEEGLSTPDKPCKEGHYCVGGSPVDDPQNQSSQGGDICQPGYVCPSGSFEPKPCPSGFYCETKGLGKPTGPCAAGSFCLQQAKAASHSMQTDLTACPSRINFGQCPVGATCPTGSAFPIPCPLGRRLLAETHEAATETRQRRGSSVSQAFLLGHRLVCGCLVPFVAQGPSEDVQEAIPSIAASPARRECTAP